MSDFFDHRRQIIMVNSKLVELLQGFDPHDWRAFRDLVASPYFNRNEDVTKLCDWIYRHSSNPVALSRAATHPADSPQYCTNGDRVRVRPHCPNPPIQISWAPNQLTELTRHAGILGWEATNIDAG